MAIRLNESGVSAVLPLGGLPECMETALTAFSSGPVRQPGREIIEAGVSGNFFAAAQEYLSDRWRNKGSPTRA
jgi:hypothetical protein